MTEPTTPTGKQHYDRVQRVGYAWFKGGDILAIEHEAAAAERERLAREWDRLVDKYDPIFGASTFHREFVHVLNGDIDEAPPDD